MKGNTNARIFRSKEREKREGKKEFLPDFVFVALEFFHGFLELVADIQLVGVEQQQNQVAALREPLANLLELVPGVKWSRREIEYKTCT